MGPKAVVACLLLGFLSFIAWGSPTTPAPLEQVRQLAAEGRLGEASAACHRVLAEAPADPEALRMAADLAERLGDGGRALELWCLLTERGGTAGDYIRLAHAYRGRFELDRTLATYERAAALHPSEEVYRDWVATLLDFRLSDEAGTRIEEALRLFPADGNLLESRAALAAQLGRDDEAVAWIRRSQAAGAQRLSWTANPHLAAGATASPYRDLLDGDLLLSGLSHLEPGAQADRLRLLSAVMEERWAGGTVRVLESASDSEVRRLGLRALRSLGKAAAGPFSALLESPDSGLRRMVLYEIYRHPLPEFLPVLLAHLPRESAAGNRDLAGVLAALLKAPSSSDAAAISTLEALPPDNTYRHLALYALAGLYGKAGQIQKAASALEAARLGRPEVPSGAPAGTSLEAYWDCMQRLDIEEVLALLEHHDRVERIDARIYGLPEDDFDDQQNLSIGERLFLRSWAERNGESWPTEGQIQYPREIRHTLREIYRTTGLVPDCSGHLAAPSSDPLLEALLGTERKLQEDSSTDNEVNIVVNPQDQRYVFVTSNDYGGSGGNDSFRSSDWGKTWATGDVPASYACDPVSYYNSSQVLYHCWLDGGVKMAYSSNQGASWTNCAAAETGGMDRQDMYIDTFAGDGGQWPASPCLNKIYVGYHNGGAQIMKVSAGASAPYCTSWSSRVNLASPGNGGTIGTAITSSIGKGSGSGRGTVLYFFSRYGSPNSGIYYSLSTNCGGSLSAPTLIRPSNTPGDFEWPIPSTCSRQTYIYPQADLDRQPLSPFRNNVYAVWNDLSSQCSPPGCSGNTTCNSDIFLAVGSPGSRDNPASWTFTSVNLTASVVGTDSYTDEFYPSVSVDPADGSVYVSYYRSNSGAGGNLTARQKQVHYVTLRSVNGGGTWSPVYQVTALPTNEYDSGANTSMQWGDYTWNRTVNGVTYPCWTDRREGADEDIWAAKVCSDPAHWSERGITPTPPPTTATAGTSKIIQVAWTAPDIYWGDGGENNAARKFQLWVDGVLNQDDIPWTTAATTYTAADCAAPHTFVVRAVNQCGVFKDYAPATVTATGCCENNPAVNVTPDGPLTLCQGVGQTLTAATSGGSGPFTYQWYRDGSQIPGAVGATYLANETGSHAYNCRVKGGGCTDGSADLNATQITWQAAPNFAGITSASAPGGTPCAIRLVWAAATSPCPGPIRYKVYRSTSAPFTPGPGNLLAAGIAATTYMDTSALADSTVFYYIVRAWDSGNGAEDGNTVTASATPTGCVLACTASASPSIAQIPVTVNFSATATPPGGYGAPAYAWDFGDGTTSTLRNPTHTYTQAGTITWSMTAGSSGLTCSKTGTILLTEPCILSCSATAAPSSGQVPLAVQFDAQTTSSGCPGSATYSWNFGDGASSAEVSPSHTYASPGTYTWWLSVRAGGEICSQSGTVTVAGPCSLACSVSASAPNPNPPSTVSFATAVSAPDCPGVPAYAWTFGDGTTSSEANPVHTYPTSGNYSWRLTVTQAGLSCTRMGTIRVGTPPKVEEPRAQE